MAVSTTVNILGTLYTIVETAVAIDDKLRDCDGYTDWTSKQIVVEREITGNLANMESYISKVKRHEIVHAFLEESGLGECSNWARNEEVVDWIARMAPKLVTAWKEAGSLGQV